MSKSLRTMLVQGREKIGMKQGDAAAALSISQSFLCDIEKGRRDIKMSILRKMAEVYSLDHAELLKLAFEPEEPELTPEETTLLHAYRKGDRAHLSTIINQRFAA